MAAGRDHSCGVRPDGSAVCWGEDAGRLLDAPSGVFTSVTAGVEHTCGLRAGGAVSCWGSNGNARLLDAPSGTFTAVEAGYHHTCGLRTGGGLVCWGRTPIAPPPAGVVVEARMSATMETSR